MQRTCETGAPWGLVISNNVCAELPHLKHGVPVHCLERKPLNRHACWGSVGFLPDSHDHFLLISEAVYFRVGWGNHNPGR